MSNPTAIALLAAKLDQGGVADHVHLLAEALTRRGLRVLALERSPGFVTTTRTQCDLAGVDWIGLHFVSYGWAQNGILSPRDIGEIRAACAGRRLILYLHELWIGASTREGVKNRLIGLAQRHRLRQLLRLLNPDHILTSNPSYQAMLKQHHIPSEVLPLPGNLPMPTTQDRQAARRWLDEHQVTTGTPLAAVFGTIHPEWEGAPVLTDWSNHLAKQNRSGTLLTMGRHGPAGRQRLAETTQRVPGLRIISTAEQPAALIAGLLRECSFALATSPWRLVGKSGTAAAFLEAGLPVLVTRDDWRCRSGPTPEPTAHPRLHKWPGPREFAWEAFLATRCEPHSRRDEIAAAWIKIMAATSRQ